MKKHIKFSAEAVGPDFQKVKVVILEQTHKQFEFGNMDGGGSFTHNGYTLYSRAYPAVNGIDRVFLRGDMTEYDNQALELPVSEYQKFKAAVEAYNKAFDKVAVERKHIKLQALPVGPDFQTVEVQIMEQTHRGSKFGAKGNRFEHGGFTLRSVGSIANYSGGMYMRGSCADRDNAKVTFTVAEYQKLKAAVEAYNKEFAGDVDEAPKVKATVASATVDPACVVTVG